MLDSSNAALAARYDEIPYAAVPHPLTHPDRLATVATFFGKHPPDVARCCVLEVGCSDGANLIPMAVALPDARFVGCDLSPRSIERGLLTIEALGLTNVVLVEEDIATLSPTHGSFDYIVAHGFFSWVPPHARDALFALARDRLSADGVLYVSYNALPGCRIRQIAWDILHAHVDRLDSSVARVAEARRFARMLADAGKTTLPSDEAVRAEFRTIAARSDSAICHDDLAVPNDPYYFRDFAAHAARYGLAFVAEVDLHSMSAAGVSAELRAYLSTLDPLSREQYLDFVRLRRFRQSLLQRSDAKGDLTVHPQRVATMHVSADPSLIRAAQEGKVGDLARALDPTNGERGPVRALLDALVDRAPAAMPIGELRQVAKTPARPVEAILTDAFVSSIVALHVHPPAVATMPYEKPEASPLARHQARERDEVTTLIHTRARLPDALTQRLLTLVDGTRDRAALAAAINGPAFSNDRGRAHAFVDFSLAQFARLGLLRA